MARPAGIIGWRRMTEGGTGAEGAPDRNPSIREWPCDASLSLSNFQAVDPAAKATLPRRTRSMSDPDTGTTTSQVVRPERISWLARDGWPLADDRVKQVKEANDIVAVIEGYLELRPAGAHVQGAVSLPRRSPSLLRSSIRSGRITTAGPVINTAMSSLLFKNTSRSALPKRSNFWPAAPESPLEKTQNSVQNQGRAAMLDVIRWAAQQFHECLLDSPLAEEARRYLGARGLTGETVRRYGLGYAPRGGDWLVQSAEAAGVSLEMLEKVGLIAPTDRTARLLRSLSRSRAVSDSRRARSDGWLRRTHLAHIASIVARAKVL